MKIEVRANSRGRLQNWPRCVTAMGKRRWSEMVGGSSDPEASPFGNDIPKMVEVTVGEITGIRIESWNSCKAAEAQG